MAINNVINYFISGPNQDNNKRVGAESTRQLQRDFEDFFQKNRML